MHTALEPVLAVPSDEKLSMCRVDLAQHWGGAHDLGTFRSMSFCRESSYSADVVFVVVGVELVEFSAERVGDDAD